MHDKSNPARSRRATSARHKSKQFDAAEAGSEREIPCASQAGGEHLLGGGRSGRTDHPLEAGEVYASYTRRIHDHRTGKVWDRVFLFRINSPADFDAAEAWLDANYPLSEGDR